MVDPKKYVTKCLMYLFSYIIFKADIFPRIYFKHITILLITARNSSHIQLIPNNKEDREKHQLFLGSYFTYRLCQSHIATFSSAQCRLAFFEPKQGEFCFVRFYCVENWRYWPPQTVDKTKVIFIRYRSFARSRGEADHMLHWLVWKLPNRRKPPDHAKERCPPPLRAAHY